MVTQQTQEIPKKPIRPEATPETPVQLSKKNFLKITVLLTAILLITAGVFYAGVQISRKQTPVVLPTAPPPNIKPTETYPTSIPDKTANWLTYKNEKYGFEFKYPPELILKQDPKALISFIDNSIKTQRLSVSADITVNYLEVYPNTDFRDILMNDIVYDGSGLRPETFDKFQQFQYGQTVFYSIMSGLFEGVLSVNYYALNKNDIIAFYLVSSPVDWTNPQYDPEQNSLNQKLKKILSTFKFSNQSQSKFTCPQGGWVDCMPIMDEAKKLACSSEAENWYKTNCPDFKGFAQ